MFRWNHYRTVFVAVLLVALLDGCARTPVWREDYIRALNEGTLNSDEFLQRSVLQIECERDSAGTKSGHFLHGSGVVIRYGQRTYIATAHHVIDSANIIIACLPASCPIRRAMCRVWSYDKTLDIALLRIDLPAKLYASLVPLEFGNSYVPDRNPGTPTLVRAVGYTGYVWVKSIGYVANTAVPGHFIGNDDESPTVLLANVATNPGNSGGALIDLHNKIIGIVIANFFPAYGNTYHPITMCIPSNDIRRLLPRLAHGGEVIHAKIGITFSEIHAGYSTVLPGGPIVRSPVSGALVVSVDSASPAFRAGLRAGDVIVRVGAESIGGPEEFSRAAVFELVPWSPTRILLYRGEKRMAAILIPAAQRP